MSEAAANSHRNILLTVDESSSSDKVFEYAVKNLYREGQRSQCSTVVPLLPAAVGACVWLATTAIPSFSACTVC
jgi:hypothetical protein